MIKVRTRQSVHASNSEYSLPPGEAMFPPRRQTRNSQRSRRSDTVHPDETIQNKKMPRSCERGRVSGAKTNSMPGLEDHLHSQLDFPRVVRRGDRPEVAGREGGADVLELRVVEGVESFRT